MQPGPEATGHERRDRVLLRLVEVGYEHGTLHGRHGS
jgi:hypothetical protein